VLGEWTDELGNDTYTKEWVSTGSKSSGYITITEKGFVKFKGFTLNYQNSKHLNLKSMKRILEKYIDKVNLSYKTITRNVKNKT